jgi:hypothetical protein
MKHRWDRKVHQPALWRRIAERFRGAGQMLVRGAAEQPLLLVSYPEADAPAAEELRDSWLHILPTLEGGMVRPYHAMMRELPAMIVVLLRRRNVCTCLGHHHPPGTESRLARRLSADMGIPVGEVDLAWEAIREWQPRPLAAMATHLEEAAFARLRFHAGLLTVLLHELEHAAFPDRQEAAVRGSSDDFYAEVLGELLRGEGVALYGI